MKNSDSRMPIEEAKFQVYLRKLSLSIIQRFGIGIIILIGGLGQFMNYFYSGEQLQAIIWWRVYISLLTGALIAFLTFSEWARRWFNFFFALEFAIAIIVSGYYIVQLRSHHSIGFSMLFVLPLWTVIMPAGLSLRIFTTGCSLLAMPLVYVQTGWQPTFLVLTTIILVGSVIVSILLGDRVFYRLNRATYFRDRELEIQRQKVEYLARYDQLTGLYNRREFDNRLEEEFKRGKRYESSLSILMMDIDHFKDVNDEYGHAAGDKVLERFGALLSNEVNRSVRESDIAGRIGGEEFCLILPETNKDEAEVVAERIRKNLADEDFSTGEGTSFRVTCSIGVTEWNQAMEDEEELVRRADDALYEAKNQGRNKVVVH